MAPTNVVGAIMVMGRRGKMESKIFGVLRHAVTMVGRRLKTYAFLSVTIILSFSFLLGFLMLTDSQQYNKYKNLFSRNRGYVTIHEFVRTPNSQRWRMLDDNLRAMEGTELFTAYYGNLGDMNIYYDPTVIGALENAMFNFENLCALFLPDGAWLNTINDWPHYIDSEVVWIDGRETDFFYLETGQVILSEKIYRALHMDEKEKPIFQLRTTLGINTQLQVVGYTKSTEPIDYASISEWKETPPMILSVKLLQWLENNGAQLWGEGETLLQYRTHYVYSETPEKVVALTKSINYTSAYSVYEAQDAAMQEIQSQAGNKAIIACALLVLLGINLYSSFSNAMNERKYEIGVKRAVGASAWSIVRQFLYESLIVMLANVAISIALVANVGVLYKIFMEWQSNFLDTYVLYLTPHSMVIFGVCAVALTVVFSLIFAYKSTQVEIVQYLKAE